MNIDNRKMVDKHFKDLDKIDNILRLADACGSKITISGCLPVAWESFDIQGSDLTQAIKELIKTEYTQRKDKIIKELEDL